VFAAGETILIGSEQMIVTAVDSVLNTLMVIRGANGTTAAPHTSGNIYLLYSGAAGNSGASQGGGIANDATILALSLDALTVANVLGNSAVTDLNIHGPYTGQS
jgi:hypothetical protein